MRHLKGHTKTCDNAPTERSSLGRFWPGRTRTFFPFLFCEGFAVATESHCLGPLAPSLLETSIALVFLNVRRRENQDDVLGEQK